MNQRPKTPNPKMTLFRIVFGLPFRSPYQVQIKQRDEGGSWGCWRIGFLPTNISYTPNELNLSSIFPTFSFIVRTFSFSASTTAAGARVTKSWFCKRCSVE